MANQSPPFGIPIIDPQYCASGPHPIDLIVIKERTRGENFTVTDINGNIVFTVESNIVSIATPRQHLYLLDANGNSIVHLRSWLFSHESFSWKAFRGRSTESRDLIFTQKQSSLFQLRRKLNVFLANNTTEVCDFKIKGPTLFRHSWDVHIGDSDTVVAQINLKHGTMFSREKYMVTVCPNIDYAFIVALVVTLGS